MSQEMRATISEHEGKKYLRTIRSPVNGSTIEVDVYEVLEAFGVTCSARQHAIKKLLCAGQRDKGNELADLSGALAAVNRAIELEAGRPEQHGQTIVRNFPAPPPKPPNK